MGARNRCTHVTFVGAAPLCVLQQRRSRLPQRRAKLTPSAPCTSPSPPGRRTATPPARAARQPPPQGRPAPLGGRRQRTRPSGRRSTAWWRAGWEGPSPAQRWPATASRRRRAALPTCCARGATRCGTTGGWGVGCCGERGWGIGRVGGATRAQALGWLPSRGGDEPPRRGLRRCAAASGGVCGPALPASAASVVSPLVPPRHPCSPRTPPRPHCSAIKSAAAEAELPEFDFKRKVGGKIQLQKFRRSVVLCVVDVAGGWAGAPNPAVPGAVSCLIPRHVGRGSGCGRERLWRGSRADGSGALAAADTRLASAAGPAVDNPLQSPPALQTLTAPCPAAPSGRCCRWTCATPPWTPPAPCPWASAWWWRSTRQICCPSRSPQCAWRCADGGGVSQAAGAHV